MLRYTGFCIAIICAAISCSSSSLKKAPLLSKQAFERKQEAALPSPEESSSPSSEDALVPIAMPAKEKIETEIVSPPVNISGSYLICIEVKAATATAPELTVNCAVRDQKTNNKVALKEQYPSIQWSYELANSENLAIMHNELTLNPEWHVNIILKAPGLEQVRAQRNAIKFVLTVQDSAGIKRQEVAPVSVGFLQWKALDGARIPTHAAVGGTERDGAGNLFLCRLYIGSEIIPGKMIVHFNDVSKSNCYTTYNGKVLASHSDDGQTMLLRSDVLTITQGSFDEYFEWLPASNGLKPTQAIITGLDTLGNPLYTCRGFQAADTFSEHTPGVLRPGAPGCSHEYYGIHIKTSYQVLAWKETATKTIMDGRSILPP